MAGAKATYEYTTDTDVQVMVKIDTSNAVAAGFTPIATGLQPMRGLKMRYLLAKHPSNGRTRKIYVPSVNNGLWDDTDTINLPDNFDTSLTPVAFTVQGRIGEQRLKY